MDIIKIKTQLDGKKAERNKLLGQKEMLIDRLKDLGYSSIKVAKKSILKMENDIERMENDLQEKMEDFENKYKDHL